LPQAFGSARAQLDAALQGVEAPLTAQNASWVDCVQSVSAYLGNQLSHYYTERFFPSTSKQLALDMVHQLLSTLHTRLSTNAWMDAATKQAALHKLAAIVPLIGYPEQWQSNVEFVVHVDAHLQNVVAARRDSSAQMLDARDAPSQRYRWLMDAFQVNAYYQPTDNDVRTMV
jgi:predicted metalloendopeptidase